MEDQSAETKVTRNVEPKDMQKTQLRWLQALTVVSALMLCAVTVVAVFAVRLIGSLQPLTEQLGSVVETVDTVAKSLDADAVAESVTALQTVSEQLAAVDWTGMEENVNDALTQTRASMETVAQALETMDVEGLNEAVTDLKTIMEPLARLLGRG